MFTLKLEDGDIVFDNLGRLAFISDEERIAQSIENRFKINKSDLFYDMDYGTPYIMGKMDEKDFEVFISETIEGMSEIEDFEIIDFSVDRGNYNIDALFYKYDGEELEIELNINQDGEIEIDEDTDGGA